MKVDIKPQTRPFTMNMTISNLNLLKIHIKFKLVLLHCVKIIFLKAENYMIMMLLKVLYRFSQGF